MKSLIFFSTKRPVTIFMITMALIIFGAIGFTKLPLNLLPDISYPTLTIRTEYEGVAPNEMEDLIAKPIENAVSVIPGVVRVSSISRPGVADVIIEFEWNKNMDFAALDVREKLDLVYLPKEAEQPVLLRFDPSLDPIMRIGLYGGEDLTTLRVLAEEDIKQKLEGLEGVAAVKVSGGLEEEIHVEYNEKKLAALGITSSYIANRIAQENVNLTGGTLKEGDAEYITRIFNEFQRVDEIADIEIGRDPSGAAIKLGDVATIKRSHKERDIITQINGEESVEIAIFKEADANTVTVARLIKAELDELQKDLRKLTGTIKMEIVSDQSTFIEQSVDEVIVTALIGGVLAVIVLYFFLRDLKSTTIITLAIPVSVISTFFFMMLCGVSLNIMSLGGLALGIGMLVDNSIVVLESIDRFKHEGLDSVESANRGASEVGTAVFASTLTTVCVFLPIIFVKGIAGQLFADQALTVTFSLSISLLVALTLIPMLSALKLESAMSTNAEQADNLSNNETESEDARNKAPSGESRHQTPLASLHGSLQTDAQEPESQHQEYKVRLITRIVLSLLFSVLIVATFLPSIWMNAYKSYAAAFPIRFDSESELFIMLIPKAERKDWVLWIGYYTNLSLIWLAFLALTGCVTGLIPQLWAGLKLMKDKIVESPTKVSVSLAVVLFLTLGTWYVTDNLGDIRDAVARPGQVGGKFGGFGKRRRGFGAPANTGKKSYVHTHKHTDKTGSSVSPFASASQVHNHNHLILIAKYLWTDIFGGDIKSIVEIKDADPDNEGIQDIRISDLNVTINMEHLKVGNLIISLTSPDGKTVLLHNREHKLNLVPSSGQGTNLPQENSKALIGFVGEKTYGTEQGNLVPSENLSAFYGGSALGKWTLRIHDQATGKPVDFKGWTLKIRGERQPVYSKPLSGASGVSQIGNQYLHSSTSTSDSKGGQVATTNQLLEVSAGVIVSSHEHQHELGLVSSFGWFIAGLLTNVPPGVDTTFDWAEKRNPKFHKQIEELRELVTGKLSNTLIFLSVIWFWFLCRIGGAVLLMKVIIFYIKLVGQILNTLLYPLFAAFELCFSAVNGAYPLVIRLALRHKTAIITIAFVAMFISWKLFQQLGMDLIPEMSQGEFLINVEMPSGTPLATTQATINKMEKIMREDKDVASLIKRVYTIAGTTSQTGGSASEERENIGQISVKLKDGVTREQERRIMDILRQKYEYIPALENKFSRPALFSFSTPVEIEITGDSLKKLHQIATELADKLRNMPGLTDVRATTEGGNPEIEIIPRRNRLAHLKTNVGNIAQVVKSKVLGEIPTEFTEREREIDVRVWARQEDRDSVADLENLTINTKANIPIRLGSVTYIKRERGPSEIRRIDQERAAIVYANLAGRDLAGVIKEIENIGVKLEDKYPGYRITPGGQAREMAVALPSMVFALCLAIFLVYLVMASQFESLLHPFVIMFTVPFGMIGVAIALRLTEQPISVVVLIGIVMLAGIVVNNAIVLVDCINIRRHEGMERREAIVEAGRLRLRPILMTTATTVLGLLPMALGIGKGAELRAPMGITVIGGLLTATLLTLVFIPTVYDIVESVKDSVKKFFLTQAT